MQFSTVLMFVGAVAAGYTNGTVVTTTEVVQSIVTFCPVATTITHGTKTYTAKGNTTLTITDCPCTVTRTMTPTSAVVCNTCSTGPKESKPPAPVQPSGPAATGGLTPKPSQPPVVAGAAKLSGAGLAAVLGAAMLL